MYSIKGQLSQRKMLVQVNGNKLKIDRQQQQLLGVILCFFMHLR